MVGKREGKRLLGKGTCSWGLMKLVFKKEHGRAWMELIWLWIGTNGGLYKTAVSMPLKHEIAGLYEKMAASRERFCPFA